MELKCVLTGVAKEKQLTLAENETVLRELGRACKDDGCDHRSQLPREGQPQNAAH